MSVAFSDLSFFVPVSLSVINQLKLHLNVHGLKHYNLNYFNRSARY
jgi:hypothetical protein